MKICRNCKTNKEDSEFYKHPANRDGLQSWCKVCKKAYKQTQEYKKYGKEYYRIPEVRQKALDREKTPEALKKKRDYGKKPETKKRLRDLSKTPKYRETKRKWRQTPKGKEQMICWSRSDKRRDNVLKRIFGITLDDYNNMLLSQNSRCDICKKHQSEFKQRLAVDHCHKTNKVRGLLCFPCNTGIGRFGDDIKMLEAAIAYLKKHNED